MKLQNHLKMYRARLGISQQRLGELTHTSRQEIGAIERGEIVPSVSMALRLAKVCGCQVNELFEYRTDCHTE